MAKQISVGAVTTLGGGSDPQFEHQLRRQFASIVLQNPDKDNETVATVLTADGKGETRIESAVRLMVLAMVSAFTSGKGTSGDGHAVWVGSNWSQFARTGLAKLNVVFTPKEGGRTGARAYAASIKDLARMIGAKAEIVGASVEAYGLAPTSTRSSTEEEEGEPEVAILAL